MLKREITPEKAGDVFDRQRCIDGWDQAKIEAQRALVLGTGAIGCSVAMSLARIGVRRIVLVDKDVVEASNLNRQCLFGPADVGRRKVDAAADELRRCHAAGGPSRTEIVAMHCDVTAAWQDIVAVARDSTVIFNNIDIGAQFDFACLALAKHLRVPCASASSFGRQWLVEYFCGSPGKSSFSYENREGPKEVFEKLLPDKVATYDRLDFITRDSNPPTRAIGSSVFVAVSAGLNAVSTWALSLFGETMPNWSKVDIVHYYDPSGLVSFPHPDE